MNEVGKSKVINNESMRQIVSCISCNKTVNHSIMQFLSCTFISGV